MTSNAATHTVTHVRQRVFPSAVLSFAAPIEAGKTTVSTRVATHLAAPRVSFGGYLRRVAHQRGLEITRETLQDLGDELVSDDVRGFCEEVLKEEPWQEGRPLIVDGVRHVEVLDTLRDIVAPAEAYLIYIQVDRTIQRKRLAQDELRHEKPLEELEQHPTEVQVRSKLPDRAALILDGTQAPEELTQKVIEFFESRMADGGLDHSWQEKNSRRIELAEKKNRVGLDVAELAEFDRLQTEYFDYLDAKHPRTPVDLDILDRLEARLKASEGN
jgi:adenylate kinase family enzyme